MPTWGTRALQAGKQRSRLRGLIQGISRNEDHVRGREVALGELWGYSRNPLPPERPRTEAGSSEGGRCRHGEAHPCPEVCVLANMFNYRSEDAREVHSRTLNRRGA